MKEPTISEIAVSLRRDADALARKLLPAGAYGPGNREWVCRGGLSPTGYAISVHVGRDAKQGVVGFWNGPTTGGDMLDLIERAMGLTKAETLHWAKQWLGIAKGRQINSRVTVRATTKEDDGAADSARRLGNAKGLWDRSIEHSPILSAYFATRGLDPQRCAAEPELRFHSGLRHPNGGTFPAMVARVSNVEGETLGVWRTFLKLDGCGKAPVEPAKLGLGDVGGGAVRLGGLWPQIGIAEGIETALACAIMFKLPVWAALSTSGMKNIVLPDAISRVRIFADSDPVKFRNGLVTPSPGLVAAETLAGRLQGIEFVKIERPPTGMDWLDVLKATNEKSAA